MEFIGSYEHNLDEKGRVFIPSSYRKEITKYNVEDTEVMLTRGLDDCLYLFPMNSWNEFKEELKKLPTNNAKYRSVVRNYLSGVTICKIDKQGRIVIPIKVREAIGIGENITFAGVGSRIEIWDTEIFNANTLGKEELDEIFEEFNIKLPS